MLGTHVENISHFGFESLSLTDNKVSRAFGVLFNFVIFEKMDQRNRIKFCLIN